MDNRRVNLLRRWLPKKYNDKCLGCRTMRKRGYNVCWTCYYEVDEADVMLCEDVADVERMQDQVYDTVEVY